jgi:protein TonB
LRALLARRIDALDAQAIYETLHSDGRHVAGGMMRREESVPVPRSWTGKDAWKGAGSSILLHLFVGAGLVAALSGPPKPGLRVVDLTLLPPAGIDRRPVPPVSAAATPARDRKRTVLPEPPSPPVTPTVADPPDMTVTPAVADPHDVTAPSNPSGPAAHGIASVFPHPPDTGSPTGSHGPTVAATGSRPSGEPGARSPAADFTWVRDAIQNAIAYPATARRMGWEGKVVVAFRLLSDGSIRDVRVLQGSGHAALDRGAIDAVRNASPFLRSPVEAEVITPVVYRLTAR